MVKRKDKEKESSVEISWTLKILITLRILCVILLALLVYSVSPLAKNNNRYHTPGVVVKFLDAVIGPDSDLGSACAQYLVTSGGESRISGDTSTQDYVHFETVFFSFNDGVASYEIRKEFPGYAEVVLYDDHGSELYPCVAFHYSLNPDGTMIEDYSIARLQPFSTKDREYNELWY